MDVLDPVTGGILIRAVEAKGPFARARGLKGEIEPAPSSGMIFRTKQVHTMGMRFAIDAIYVAADGRVIKVVTLPPNRIGPLVLRAKWVLETAAGEARRLGIAKSGKLVLGA